MKNWGILGGQWVGLDNTVAKDIKIGNGKIESVIAPTNTAIQNFTQLPVLELDGHFVYPGLINSHDHLMASFLPKVSTSHKHSSWLSFDNQVKSSSVFHERQKLDIEQLYFLGAYKNLFSGVTRVMDHIPHFVQDPFRDSLPISLVHPFSLSHSICSYSLNWGTDPTIEYQMAKEGGYAFVTHIAEGFDEESRNSLSKLKRMGALGRHSVLVHGLSFSDEDIHWVQEADASVVWCPTSNHHIFRKTSPIRSFLKAGIRVCLGTDASTSGGLNLWEEMRFAKNIYEDTYGESLSARKIFEMVVTNPSQAFFLESHPLQGIAGETADILVLEKKHTDPFENLLGADLSSILLLSVNGIPKILDESLKNLSLSLDLEMEQIQMGQKKKLVLGSPKTLLMAIAEKIGNKKDLAFLPIGSN